MQLRWGLLPAVCMVRSTRAKLIMSINHLQRLHRLEVVISRGAEGKTGKAFVGDMTEEKSLELASKLASEGFVFGVSAMHLKWRPSLHNHGDMDKPDLQPACNIGMTMQPCLSMSDACNVMGMRGG